jgi:hypothetical protein
MRILSLLVLIVAAYLSRMVTSTQAVQQSSLQMDVFGITFEWIGRLPVIFS